MANNLTISTRWYVFPVGGNELNAGGFDSSTPSAGTNYANQAAPHCTIDNSTVTATGAAGAALGDMTITGATVAASWIGNFFRLASGTNCTAQYGRISAVDTGTNKVTIDKTSTGNNLFTGAASNIVGRIGGAFLDIRNVSVGGTGPAPILASPFASCNECFIDGQGIANPTISNAVDWSAGSWTITAAGLIRGQLAGVNGVPAIILSATGIGLNSMDMAHFRLWMGAANTQMFLHTTGESDFTDVIVETQGYVIGAAGIFGGAGILSGCGIINSGTVNTTDNIPVVSFKYIDSCIFKNIGNKAFASPGYSVINSVFENLYRTAFSMVMTSVGATSTWATMRNNVINNMRGDGITIISAVYAPGYSPGASLINNIISNCSGVALVGDAQSAINDPGWKNWKNNNFYNNAGGNFTNFTPHTSDISVDPQFNDIAHNDWRSIPMIGLGIGNFPGTTPIGAMNPGYIDETTRNVSAGAANILTGHSDTIATVVTNGTFSEAARNVGAGVGNILAGVSEKIQNATVTGTLSRGAVSIG
jgi:hypothetical protein